MEEIIHQYYIYIYDVVYNHTKEDKGLFMFSTSAKSNLSLVISENDVRFPFVLDPSVESNWW